MVFFAPFNDPFKVNNNTITVNAVTQPDVGVDGNGNYIVVWQEPFGNDTNDFDIRGTFFAPDGSTAISFPEVFISVETGSELEPSIAVAPDGAFVVAYSRNNDIFARRFNLTRDGIRQVGDEILVSTFEQDRRQFSPQVAIDAEGDFSIVWTHEFQLDDFDIRGRIFNADGTPFTDDLPVSASFSDESQSAIAIVPTENDNNPDTVLASVVSYTVNFDNSETIFFRRFGNEGNEIGVEINAVSELNRSRSHTESSIAMDAQGNLVSACTHEYEVNDTDIHLRRFRADGSAIDNMEIVVDDLPGNQNNPDVALAPDGSIMVTYTDESSNTIKYRQFDSNGNALGERDSFNVEENQQENSAVAIASNNKAIIVADAGNNGILNPYGQILAPDVSNILDDSFNRFQNSARPGTYLFAGEAESQNILNDFSPPFQLEGEAFSVSEEAKDDLIRFNRFQNLSVPGTYLFASEEESVNIRQNFRNFDEEGVAFYAFGAGANQATPFYRFQNTQAPGTYIFVGDTERQNIIQNFPQFVEEGIAFEAGI